MQMYIYCTVCCVPEGGVSSENESAVKLVSGLSLKPHSYNHGTLTTPQKYMLNADPGIVWHATALVGAADPMALIFDKDNSLCPSEMAD